MKMPWECPTCRAENGSDNDACLWCGAPKENEFKKLAQDIEATPRQDILAEVAAVLTERQDRHGQAEDSFGLIAAFWGAYLGVEVSKRDAAVMMALFKIARGKVQPANRDNDRDAIGYMAIAADRTGATAQDQQPLQTRSLAAVLDVVTAAGAGVQGDGASS